MKKKLAIPNISKPLSEIKNIKRVLKQIDYHHINTYAWEQPDNNRNIRFKIAHNNQSLFLQYHVIEPEMMAVFSTHNSAVCRDSCVEFFIALDDDANYYNFEFNAIGTCLLGWGPDRHHREFLDTNTINLIKVKTKIKRINTHGSSLFNWKITIEIPINTFKFNNLKSFENIKARANFYKCGDNLLKPHFITWNPVVANKPDFHLKAYFGDIQFL